MNNENNKEVELTGEERIEIIKKEDSPLLIFLNIIRPISLICFFVFFLAAGLSGSDSLLVLVYISIGVFLISHIYIIYSGIKTALALGGLKNMDIKALFEILFTLVIVGFIIYFKLFML